MLRSPSRALIALTAGLMACQDGAPPTAIRGITPMGPLAQVATGPVVNSLLDDGDGTCTDAKCTLRDAITFADPGATITFSVTGVLGLTAGQLSITKDVTITGPGANQLFVSRSSASLFRIFYVDVGVAASISGLQISNGHVENGGGIYNAGSLALTQVAVVGNRSEGDIGAEPGGGIYNPGRLVLTQSIVVSNFGSAGGGIFSTGTLTITNSSIVGNSAHSVGAILTQGGTTTISQSTVRGNGAGFNGSIVGPATISNSIVASNSPQNCSHGPQIDGGYNLDSGNSCGFSAATSLSNTDPQLDPAGLQSNGGPTFTIALVAGSPAIDAIPNGANGCGATITSDQRGIARPQPTGGACDIGAFEVEQVVTDATAPTITISTPAANASYTLGQSVLADYSCQDEAGGSGLASCTGPVLNGAAINTATLGAKTFKVDAVDNATNASTLTANYTVTYNFSGFAAPVDGGGVLNRAKAGRSIPLKWRLLAADGNPITSLTSVSVTVTSLPCDLGATADEVEEFATGSSGLQNLGNGYYQYNWSTPASYAKSCKTLHLNLGEGITRTALFEFTK